MFYDIVTWNFVVFKKKKNEGSAPLSHWYVYVAIVSLGLSNEILITAVLPNKF